MEIKELYRYTREEGGVTVSTEKPNCEYEITYRIIAGEGMEVTQDGVNTYCCVDTDDVNGWYEAEIPEQEEPIEAEEPVEE